MRLPDEGNGCQSTQELWAEFYEKAGITANGEECYLPIDWPVKK